MSLTNGEPKARLLIEPQDACRAALRIIALRARIQNGSLDFLAKLSIAASNFEVQSHEQD